MLTQILNATQHLKRYMPSLGPELEWFSYLYDTLDVQA